MRLSALIGLGALLVSPAATVAVAGTRSGILSAEDAVSAHQAKRETNTLLLFCVLLGDEAWQRPMLEVFLWTIKKAPSVTLVLIGDGQPSVELPPNVRIMSTTPDAMTDRLIALLGVDLRAEWEQKNATLDNDQKGELLYKLACEVRPLMPMLYPEFSLEGYKWFGWVDPDVMVGGRALQQLMNRLESCSASVISLWTMGGLGPRHAPGLSPVTLGSFTILNSSDYENQMRQKFFEQIPMMREVFTYPKCNGIGTC